MNLFAFCLAEMSDSDADALQRAWAEAKHLNTQLENQPGDAIEQAGRVADALQRLLDLATPHINRTCANDAKELLARFNDAAMSFDPNKGNTRLSRLVMDADHIQDVIHVAIIAAYDNDSREPHDEPKHHPDNWNKWNEVNMNIRKFVSRLLQEAEDNQCMCGDAELDHDDPFGDGDGRCLVLGCECPKYDRDPAFASD